MSEVLEELKSILTTMKSKRSTSEESPDVMSPVLPDIEEVPDSIESPHDFHIIEFNCPECKGEGLKNQYTLCSMCNGTGKV